MKSHLAHGLLQGQSKTLTRELNPRPSVLITGSPPTELQGQTGAAVGTENFKVMAMRTCTSTRKDYVFANVGRVALILGLTLTWFIWGRYLALHITL